MTPCWLGIWVVPHAPTRYRRRRGVFTNTDYLLLFMYYPQKGFCIFFGKSSRKKSLMCDLMFYELCNGDIGNGGAASTGRAADGGCGNAISQTNAWTPRLAMSIKLIKHTAGERGRSPATHALPQCPQLTHHFNNKSHSSQKRKTMVQLCTDEQAGTLASRPCVCNLLWTSERW